MSKSGWQDATRSRPCPICQKAGYCGTYVSGVVCCRFVNNGLGREKTDKNGDPYYVYGSGERRGPDLDLPTPLNPPRAVPEVLHKVYARLLDELTLSDPHRKALNKRGLPDAEITARGHRSLPTRGRSEIARRLVEAFGADTCAQVPGLYWKESEAGQRYLSLSGRAGLLIPMRTPAGIISAICIRPDEPGDFGKYQYLTSSKHEGPGPGAQVHVPLFTGATHTVRITEGALKADVATYLSKLLTLGLPGVSGILKALPMLRELGVSKVHIAIDADAHRNHHVASALLRVVDHLQVEAFAVILEMWDEVDGKGIDDLLAGDKQPALFTGGAVEIAVRGIQAKAEEARKAKAAATASQSLDALLQAAGLAAEADLPARLREIAEVLGDNPVMAERTAERVARLKLTTKKAFQELHRKLWKELRKAKEQTARIEIQRREEVQRAQHAGVAAEDTALTLQDFRAYMREHLFIFAQDGSLWPAASVNARIPPVPTGEYDAETGNPKTESATRWLARERPVEQLTWAPGEPQVIQDRLIVDGGWVEAPGRSVWNLYRPGVTTDGDPSDVGPWWEHLIKVFSEEHATYIVKWLAHRVQRPGEKLNHALVLGGAQGIGKDTILEPVKAAVGPWNFQEVTPVHLLGRFNGFVKSVILRVSEARDLGEVDRYAFYEHTKQYIAAPPDVLRCDEKNCKEYPIPNVCGVVITTNHRLNGLYLPEDDRRHFVTWSDCAKEEFSGEYWAKLWEWYEAGGTANVAAYLQDVDLSDFDSKAPPPKTEAWYSLVGMDRAPEDEELADALQALYSPEVVSKEMLLAHDLVPLELKEWLRDRKNTRSLPHRLEKAGYIAIRNSGQADGRWKIAGRNVTLYGPKEKSERDRQAAATALALRSRIGP